MRRGGLTLFFIGWVLLLFSAMAVTAWAEQGSHNRCRGMLTVAHQGAGEYGNTLRAFRQAKRLIDGSELDARRTSDGVWVVLHDRDLSRTTDGTGNVDERRWRYVKHLTVTGGFRVPKLSQALNLGGRFVIEVKPDPRWNKLFARSLSRVIGGQSRKVVVSSSHANYLRDVDSAKASIETAWKGPNVGIRTVVNWADSVIKQRRNVSTRQIRYIHRKGGNFYVGKTADGHWRGLKRLGVDGFVTNHPQRLKKWCS